MEIVKICVRKLAQSVRNLLVMYKFHRFESVLYEPDESIFIP